MKFLPITVALFLTGSLSATDVSKPNVLFLAVDDMNDWIGCLEGSQPGDGPRAITPNFDKLAARGVCFTNAHTAGVFCAPSRAAIFSGQFASTTGCYETANYFVNRPEIESLQTGFSKAGYTTLGTGKLYHHPVGAIDQRGWTEFFLRSEAQRNNGWSLDSWSEGTPFPKLFPASVYNEGEKITGGLFLEWAGLPNEQEKEMADTMRINWAVDQLQKKHDTPFFLACGIYAPHYPHYCPQKYFDLYDPNKIELPKYKADDLIDLPPKIERSKTGRLKIRQKLEDLDALDDAIHGYLACISYADAMMGRVLDALEASPYANNTIVVLWSDHGYHLGEKNWGKHTLWERTSNVPFIWAGPGVAQGAKADVTVSLIDMYPTLVEMCGLPKPPQLLEGESIAATLKNPAEAKDRNVFLPYTTPGEFAVINRDWRYIRYGEDGEELYDVQADPHEWHNLAASPEHKSRMAELRKFAPEKFAGPEPRFNARKDLVIEGETYRWEKGAGNYTPPPKYLPYTKQTSSDTNQGFATGKPWTELFNGKTLDGWTERNKSGSFRVEDGAIIGTAKEGLGTTFLCTDKEYADFELEFETKLIDPELNSGVQIRSGNREPKGKQKVGPVEGPQVEFAAKSPDRGSRSGNIFGQGWGQWLTPDDEIRNHKFVKADEWNQVRVVARGNRVTTWINGNEIVKTTIPPERHATHSKGFIGLQIHGIKDGTGPFEVAWRNIRIRTFTEKEKPDQPRAKAEDSKRIELKHQGPETSFRVLPEFRDHDLTFFAMAPEINCPVSVIAEPGGAVYALCDGNAGLGRLPDQGSVWRLIDEDDDGRADFATPYLPNIDTPRGGQFLNGTLYLVHPPFISACRDTDGDGIADERKVLASGFAHDLSWKRGGDHSTNDLKIGIDGWIYVAVGDFGASAVGSDGSTAKLQTGGVIRMRLDGSDLEIYARGTRNTYDIAINHRLDIIAMDNTNDGDGWDMRLHNLTPLAHMGYPNLYKNFSEDAMPPLFTYGGGSGCGALYLEEPGFPDWLNRKISTISWGKLYTHDLEPHEATFVNSDNVTLSINKLVDLDIDGSSRLYLANFEGGGARIEPGSVVGHIVQAKPKGWKYRPFPDLSEASIEELIGFLDRESAVLRQQAQPEIVGRKSQGIQDALQVAVNKNSASLESRIAALFAINLRNELGSVDLLKGWLENVELAEYAFRALLDRNDRLELALDPVIESFLKHENPRVRLQAVAGAARLEMSQATATLLDLSLEEPRQSLVKDVAHVHQAVPHTAGRALIEMAPVAELHAALDDEQLRPAALAVLRQIHSSENVKKLIEALQASENPDESLDLVATLLRLYQWEKEWDGNDWWGTRPNSAGPYYLGVAWEESKAIARALRQAVAKMSEEGQKATLFQVRRHNLPLDQLNLPIEVDPLEQLLEQSSHPFEQQADLLSIVEDSARPKAMREKAFRAALQVTGFTYAEWCLANLRALSKLENEVDLYQALSREFVQSPSHRISMMQRLPKAESKIRKLDSSSKTLFYDVICTLVQSPLTTEENRKRLVGGMKTPSSEFLESIKKHRATAFESLVSKAAKEAEFKELSGEILASFEQEEKGQLVGALSVKEASAATLKMEGDTELGKKLFVRQSCNACHSIQPNEPQKGPYLGSVGNLFNREQLITHIIDPGAEIAQGFQTYQFELKDGTAASGFVTARDEKTIELRNVAGISQKISVSDVAKEKVLKISMMPPGLVNNLTVPEFASLIDYLQSLH